MMTDTLMWEKNDSTSHPMPNNCIFLKRSETTSEIQILHLMPCVHSTTPYEYQERVNHQR